MTFWRPCYLHGNLFCTYLVEFKLGWVDQKGCTQSCVINWDKRTTALLVFGLLPPPFTAFFCLPCYNGFKIPSTDQATGEHLALLSTYKKLELVSWHAAVLILTEKHFSFVALKCSDCLSKYLIWSHWQAFQFRCSSFAVQVQDKQGFVLSLSTSVLSLSTAVGRRPWAALKLAVLGDFKVIFYVFFKVIFYVFLRWFSWWFSWFVCDF